MQIQKKHQAICIFSAILFCCTVGQGSTKTDRAEDTSTELPGYYEFFMKAGKLSRLNAEVKRDEKIQTGEIKPVYSNEPVLDLRLPDGFGQWHGTRDHVGKKNLVLITGRAWW